MILSKSILATVVALSSSFAFASGASPSKTPMDCVLNGFKTESAYVYEAASENGQTTDVILYTKLPASAAPNNPYAILAVENVIMKKDLNGAITQDDEQSVDGTSVKLAYKPINEKDRSVVTLAGDMKTIVAIDFYQKIYDSYADLLLPLHVNKTRCTAAQ